MRRARERQRRGAWWRARRLSLSLSLTHDHRQTRSFENVYALGEEEERKEKKIADDSFGVENFVYSTNTSTVV
jgi:hypothetical protein